MKKVGVCWFDKSKMAEGGWISIGGSPAKRVDDAGQLQMDVLWVTNIDFTNHRKLYLGNSKHIFYNQYFKTSLNLLANELGLSHDPESLVSVASSVLSRVYRLGEKLYNIDEHDTAFRFSNILGSYASSDLTKSRAIGRFAEDVEIAVKQSTQENQSFTGVRIPPGSKRSLYLFPRASYAEWLLKQPVPVSNNWNAIRTKEGSSALGTVNGKQVRGSTYALRRLEEIAENSAAIFRIKIIETSKFNRGFQTFGVGANYNRSWATLPEVLYLAKYCSLEISGGYKTDLGQLPLDVDYKIGFGSLSKGIFLENLWAAIVTDGNSSGHYSGVGAYLRAYDRIACGMAAEKLSQNGFFVGSYGSGKIAMFLRSGDKNSATKKALKLGLLPSIPLIHEAVK